MIETFVFTDCLSLMLPRTFVFDVAKGAAGELVEDFGDEAHAGDGLEDVVVDGDDSGAFLAAVLEGM